MTLNHCFTTFNTSQYLATSPTSCDLNTNRTWKAPCAEISSDCFQCTDWNIYKVPSADIHEYAALIHTLCWCLCQTTPSWPWWYSFPCSEDMQSKASSCPLVAKWKSLAVTASEEFTSAFYTQFLWSLMNWTLFRTLCTLYFKDLSHPHAVRQMKFVHKCMHQSEYLY